MKVPRISTGYQGKNSQGKAITKHTLCDLGLCFCRYTPNQGVLLPNSGLKSERRTHAASHQPVSDPEPQRHPEPVYSGSRESRVPTGLGRIVRPLRYVLQPPPPSSSNITMAVSHLPCLLPFRPLASTHSHLVTLLSNARSLLPHSVSVILPLCTGLPSQPVQRPRFPSRAPTTTPLVPALLSCVPPHTLSGRIGPIGLRSPLPSRTDTRMPSPCGKWGYLVCTAHRADTERWQATSTRSWSGRDGAYSNTFCACCAACSHPPRLHACGA